MTDRIPVRAIVTGGVATGLAEMQSGDTVPVANGGTGSVDASGARTSLGVEPAITPDLVSKYWSGIKTWRDLFADVRASTLTGLSLASSAAVTAADTVLGAIGKLQAQISDRGADTGDFMFQMRATPRAGWIVGMGQSIGNTGSGATLTGASVQPLFNLWWADYSNAQLPILTSAGGASTRGASAAADWAAGKRLTVFDMRGQFARSAGTAEAVNGTKQIGSSVAATAEGDTTLRISSNGTAVQNGEQVSTAVVSQTGIAGGFYGAAVSFRFVKVRPDNIAMLGCFKL